MYYENLGKIDYDSALELQLREKELVKAGKSPGKVFFLEHVPPVVTLGRHARTDNLLVSKELLASRGYEVRNVSRGGDVTVHEEGQLVVYFVVPLKSKAVRNFVDGVMTSVKQSLSKDFSIGADLDRSRPGLWVGEEKICSVGFDLTGKVSMHGIALNVCNSLEGFSFIVPCGLQKVKMTSISIRSGHRVEVSEAVKSLTKHIKF